MLPKVLYGEGRFSDEGPIRGGPGLRAKEKGPGRLALQHGYPARYHHSKERRKCLG